MNHYLFATVKFKRKFERIIWTFWVKDGLPYFDLYFINKKDQKLPIELDDEYSEYAKKNTFTSLRSYSKQHSKRHLETLE